MLREFCLRDSIRVRLKLATLDGSEEMLGGCCFGCRNVEAPQRVVEPTAIVQGHRVQRYYAVVVGRQPDI